MTLFPDRSGGPLLKTKLSAPHLRASLVTRPRLFSLLAEGVDRILTLVCAPAGYGKSTLLAEWISSYQTPSGSINPTFCWLSLDSGDNDAGRFLSYLTATLFRALPELDSSASRMLLSPQPLPHQSVLDTLINDLSELPAPIIVVLDDYQVIDSSHVNEIVTYLLDHPPPQLRLVIATRSDPVLPLARLRGRNQLVEIRSADLKFTSPESIEFLNRVMGLALTVEEIEALEVRTEGWIVGMQMAAIAIQSRLSLQGRQYVSEFIQSFSGSHRYILEYLGEEVLSRQSEDIKTFLLHTSILERLCGPLCDAIIGQPLNSQEKLERLDKANLFLIPLDDEHRWYRYHHLFADLLQTHLQRAIGVQGIAQLHLRAADWYEQNGLAFEAIQHASIASDYERVERLIEQNYMDMVNRGEFSSIRYWTGKLSKELVYKRPWLCIYEAQSRSWYGRLDEADVLLQVAEKRIQSTVPTPETQSMLGHLAYVQSRVAAIRGDTRRAIELSLIARENTPSTNLALQLGISVTLGYIYFLAGDISNASKTLLETIRSGSAVGAINSTIGAYGVLARLRAIQGQLNHSYNLYQDAMQLIHKADGQHLGAVSVVEVGMADVLCEWNDLETALVRVKNGLDFIPLWGKADDLVLAYTTLSRIQLAQGNRAAAIDAIEKANQFVQTRGVFSEARAAVETAQVKLWLAQGDLQAASRWAASLEKRFSSGDSIRFENELAQITRARVSIAQNKPDEAVGILSRLEETARLGGRMGRVIEILILEALAMHQMGDFERATMGLTKCLRFAEPEGYLRIFLDEGEAMRSMLHEARKRIVEAVQDSHNDSDSRLIAYTGKLSAGFSSHSLTPPIAVSGLQPPLVESLSQRELEVLALICQGHSNQEIVEKLVISINTVKRHNNSIFGKLGVTNRSQAIVRAHQLGLVKGTPH